MGNFNFYINVDQCLNMSNFDMFFYKLLDEKKFHLSNVQLYHDEGSYSLKKAFSEIRSYIDKTPFFLRDYRLIFGMREEIQNRGIWRQTILYRLLKIRYGLMEAGIYIQSKDSFDKNVSVIMLYDTDFAFGTSDLENPNYDLAKDLEALADLIVPDWREGMESDQIALRMEEYLALQKGSDPVTERFVREYLQQYKELSQLHEVAEAMEEHTETEIPEPVHEERGSRAKNPLYGIGSYARECVGHYCVFQKEINRSSQEQSLLALLSIVDYITSDLKPEEGVGEERRSIESLKLQSRRNWENATNDDGIHTRYGGMLSAYRGRLVGALEEIQELAARAETEGEQLDYRSPVRLRGNEEFKPQEQAGYREEFEKILRNFTKGSSWRATAKESWDEAYRTLKEKLQEMDHDLEEYGRSLSREYRQQLEERKRASASEEICGLKSVEDRMEEVGRKKQKLLEVLKKPQLNTSLRFQDQLNFENTLEQCNKEVTFFTKCQKMVKFANFALLILIGGGLFLLHYILMQTYVFSDIEMLSAFCIYVLATFVLFLLSWNAPYAYFKRKIRNSLEELKRQMEIYITGYFDKAESFLEYINTINELDAVNQYIAGLEKGQEKYMLDERKRLWHKVQLQEHIRKSGYFEKLIYSLDETELAGIRKENRRLDIHRNVVQNKVYWPQ